MLAFGEQDWKPHDGHMGLARTVQSVKVQGEVDRRVFPCCEEVTVEYVRLSINVVQQLAQVDRFEHTHTGREHSVQPRTSFSTAFYIKISGAAPLLDQI